MSDGKSPSVDAAKSILRGKLISPNGFDGQGPVPEQVTAASKTIAQLRVKYLTRQRPELTGNETKELFDAAAILAEWCREMYEVIHG